MLCDAGQVFLVQPLYSTLQLLFPILRRKLGSFDTSPKNVEPARWTSTEYFQFRVT